MLKKEKYMYESDLYRIINPNEELTDDIYKKLEEYTGKDGEIDMNNSSLILYLLQELIESDHLDYQFETYTEEDIKELTENPPTEYKNIIYYIGNIISDIIIEKLQISVLEIKKAHIELLRTETITRSNQLRDDINFFVQTEKRIKDERRVNFEQRKFTQKDNDINKEDN